MAYSTQLKQDQIVDVIQSLRKGNTLYLLGTSEQGAVNVPVLVSNVKQAIRYFGESGTLIDAMNQIEGFPGYPSIYLVKTTGHHAMAHLNLNEQNGDIHIDSLLLRSTSANEKSNEIKVEITNESLTIVHPASLGGHRLSYSYQAHPTVTLLVNAINQDAKAGDSAVSAQHSVGDHVLSQGSLSTCNPKTVWLSGGHSGLHPNKDYYYHALSDTYSVLEGIPIDVIVPLQAYIDDIDRGHADYGTGIYGQSVYNDSADKLTLKQLDRRLTYYDQLLEFCRRQLEAGIFTYGVMGFNPAESDYPVRIWIDQWNETRRHSLYHQDFGYLISVVVGDLNYNYYQSKGNGYLAYARLVSGLDVDQTPVNMKITDAISLVHDFNREAIVELASQGLVNFRNSLIHQSVVLHHDSTTYTADELGLRYYHNLKMCQLTMMGCRKLVDHYIGNNISILLKNNSLEEHLNTLLTRLIEIGVIKAYTVKIEANEQAGQIKIILTLQTKYMVDSIEITGGVILETEQEG